MATYIVLVNLTEQGIRNVRETTKRAEAFRKMASGQGVTIKDIYWTLGAFDLVVTVDAPDIESATALSLGVGGAGNVRTQTLPAFSSEQMAHILSKMG